MVDSSAIVLFDVYPYAGKNCVETQHPPIAMTASSMSILRKCSVWLRTNTHVRITASRGHGDDGYHPMRHSHTPHTHATRPQNNTTLTQKQNRTLSMRFVPTAAKHISRYARSRQHHAGSGLEWCSLEVATRHRSCSRK